MAIIVAGKTIANEMLADLQLRVERLAAGGGKAALAVVLVGDDKPSQIYIRKKSEAARQIGVAFFDFHYPADITHQQLIEEVRNIQHQHDLSGMIVQLPVPEPLWPYAREVADHIALNIDVDCLSHQALGRMMMNENRLIPPTPAAILHILRHYDVSWEGKEICLVGRGDLIGRPLAAMLTHEKVTLTVCGRATKDLARYTRSADIVVTGVGKRNLVRGDMLKKGAVVIDAGVSFVDGMMYGDVEFASAREVASLITPVPGGVGPITVAKLLENTMRVAEMKLSQTV